MDAFPFFPKKGKRARLQGEGFEPPEALSHRIASAFFFLPSEERKTPGKKKEPSFFVDVFSRREKRSLKSCPVDRLGTPAFAIAFEPQSA